MIQTLFGSTEEKPSFLKRMKEAVTRTRESLSERIDDVVAFRKLRRLGVLVPEGGQESQQVARI